MLWQRLATIAQAVPAATYYVVAAFGNNSPSSYRYNIFILRQLLATINPRSVQLQHDAVSILGKEYQVLFVQALHCIQFDLKKGLRRTHLMIWNRKFFM